MLILSSSSRAADLTLTYRGKVHLTDDESKIRDQNGAPFTITGLSGITYLGDNNYIAVMDNSNRIVALTVTFDSVGKITGYKVTGGDTIADTRDFEGIAYTNRQRNSVFISDEAPRGRFS